MELSIIRIEEGILPVLLDAQMRIVKPVLEFLKFQRFRERADNTLKAYGWDLKAFFEFLESHGYCYDEVEPVVIGDFIEYLRNPDRTENILSLYQTSERTPKTINRVLGTVYSFYQYQAMVSGICNPIVMQDINRPQGMFKSMLEHARKDNYIKHSLFKVKESTYTVKLVSEQDARRFLDALPTRRDKLIFKTMYLTGARIGEVLELQIENIPCPDFTLQIGVLTGIKSKGKRRNLYAPMELIGELDMFILEERGRFETEHGYLFLSLQKRYFGNPLTYHSFYDVFQRTKRKTGLNFKCHDLRHTFITRLVESGMDISVVSMIAGHRHITTTQEYLHISRNYLENSLGKYWSSSCMIGGDKDEEHAGRR
nr:tyrosine-type recombinase/integrase [uncultured Clostridium sp.]